MAKISFLKRGKIVREVSLNGFDFNGFQDTSTITYSYKICCVNKTLI